MVFLPAQAACEAPDAGRPRVQRISMFKLQLCLPMASALPNIKKRRLRSLPFYGQLSDKQALDRARTLRRVGVIVYQNVRFRTEPAPRFMEGVMSHYGPGCVKSRTDAMILF